MKKKLFMFSFHFFWKNELFLVFSCIHCCHEWKRWIQFIWCYLQLKYLRYWRLSMHQVLLDSVLQVHVWNLWQSQAHWLMVLQWVFHSGLFTSLDGRCHKVLTIQFLFSSCRSYLGIIYLSYSIYIIQYDMRWYVNVQSKADMSQLNPSHGTNNQKVEKQKNWKAKTGHAQNYR